MSISEKALSKKLMNIVFQKELFKPKQLFQKIIYETLISYLI